MQYIYKHLHSQIYIFMPTGYNQPPINRDGLEEDVGWERDVRVHIYIIPNTPRYIYIYVGTHLPLLVHQQNTPAIYIVPGHIYIPVYPLPPPYLSLTPTV